MRRRKPTDPASAAAAARAGAAGGEVWHDVAAALTPVIGALGFDALFGRSLLAVSAGFPWLASIDAHGPDRLAAYERALAAQDAATAAAAQAELQRTFAELLEHLVGRALAQRLLRDRVRNFSPPARRRGNARR